MVALLGATCRTRRTLRCVALQRLYVRAPLPAAYRRTRTVGSSPANFIYSSYKKTTTLLGGYFYMAPPVGLEPTTLRLTAACSTD